MSYTYQCVSHYSCHLNKKERNHRYTCHNQAAHSFQYGHFPKSAEPQIIPQYIWKKVNDRIMWNHNVKFGSFVYALYSSDDHHKRFWTFDQIKLFSIICHFQPTTLYINTEFICIHSDKAKQSEVEWSEAKRSYIGKQKRSMALCAVAVKLLLKHQISL